MDTLFNIFVYVIVIVCFVGTIGGFMFAVHMLMSIIEDHNRQKRRKRQRWM